MLWCSGVGGAGGGGGFNCARAWLMVFASIWEPPHGSRETHSTVVSLPSPFRGVYLLILTTYVRTYYVRTFVRYAITTTDNGQGALLGTLRIRTTEQRGVVR